jgi:hypothetical protein
MCCSLTMRDPLSADIAADEDGLSVVGPEGLHLFQNIIEGGSDGIEGEGGVDDQFRDQGAGLDGGGDRFFEFQVKAST